MPCEIRWYIEKRVVLQRLYGIVTIEEYVKLQQDGKVFVSEGNPPVHVLVETVEVVKAPSLIELSRLPYEREPGLGWLVTAVHNPLYRFGASVLSQFVGKNFKIVSNLDEGAAFLRRVDPSLYSEG